MTNYRMYRGHPTRFNGVLYRSRLEASWAAFFTQVGWRFQYEPLDLNKWSPDFLLLGARPMLVEVKSICEFDADVAHRMANAALWRDEELLLLGTAPRELADGPLDATRLGWLAQRIDNDLRENTRQPETEFWWDEALVRKNRNRPGKWDFHHANGSFAFRMSGDYDGDHYLGSGTPAEVGDLWAAAAYQVQYFRPKEAP